MYVGTIPNILEIFQIYILETFQIYINLKYPKYFRAFPNILFRNITSLEKFQKSLRKSSKTSKLTVMHLKPFKSRLFYLQITFHIGIIGFADLIRVWYGPLPNFICTPMQVTRHTIHMITAILWTVVALLKVWIVCIHKSVPSMDDDFIAAFVIRASFMMSFLFSIVSVILPQKPAIAHVSCQWQKLGT